MRNVEILRQLLHNDLTTSSISRIIYYQGQPMGQITTSPKRGTFLDPNQSQTFKIHKSSSKGQHRNL